MKKIGDTKNAMLFINKSYKTAIEFNDYIGSARALQLKGIYYGKRNVLDSSEYYINKSIKIVEKNLYKPIVDSTKNKNLLLNLKSNLALNHLLQKKHNSSIDYAYEAYELAKKLQNRRTETLSLGYIAGNYYALGQNKKALEFYTREKDASIELKNEIIEAFAYLHISDIQEEFQDFKNAKINIYKALEIFKKNNHSDGLLKSKHALFTHYRLIEDYSNCHKLTTELINLYKESKGDISHLYIELGEIYAKENFFDEADKYLKLAEKLLDENGGSKLLFYRKKALLEKERGDLVKSLEFKQKELEISKKELDSNFTDKIAFYDTKYKTAEKQAKINAQNLQLEKRKLQIKTQQLQIQKEKANKNIALTGIAFILLLGFGGFWLYRNKQKQAILQSQNTLLGLQQNLVEAELSNLNKQLDPHEIKNLLASISPEIQEKAPESYKKMLKLFNLTKASLNSNSITDSIENQLQQIDDFLSLEKSMLPIPLNYSIENDIQNTQTQIPRLLLKNLVENAIKHGIKQQETGGNISVQIEEKDSFIYISVDDTGKGRNLAISLDSGIGTTTYQKLFETLNPKNKEKATFEIIDKEKGTKVEVRIPTNYKYS